MHHAVCDALNLQVVKATKQLFGHLFLFFFFLQYQKQHYNQKNHGESLTKHLMVSSFFLGKQKKQAVTNERAFTKHKLFYCEARSCQTQVNVNCQQFLCVLFQNLLCHCHVVHVSACHVRHVIKDSILHALNSFVL